MLIDQLPRSSRTHEAIAQDDELAESLPEPEAGKWSPPVRDWDMTATLLAEVVDRLTVIQTQLVGLAGKKPPKAKTLPRPETAAERVQLKRDRARYNATVAIFAPHALN